LPAWLTGLMARKPYKLVAVALANKTTRIIWGLTCQGRLLQEAGGDSGGGLTHHEISDSTAEKGAQVRVLQFSSKRCNFLRDNSRQYEVI
jgi:hypothetical protein